MDRGTLLFVWALLFIGVLIYAWVGFLNASVQATKYFLNYTKGDAVLMYTSVVTTLLILVFVTDMVMNIANRTLFFAGCVSEISTKELEDEREMER